MLTATQAQVFDIQRDIENIQPLAKAERLADVAGIKPNLWVGNAQKLRELEAVLESARLADEARAFSEDVRAFRSALSARKRFFAEFSSIEASIAEFDDEARDMFTKVSVVYRWDQRVSDIDRARLEKRDRFGNIIPPPGFNIEDELWAKLLALRNLHSQRLNASDNVSSTERDIQDAVRRNPALQTLVVEEALQE